MSIIISIRIRKELKDRLDRYGINISKEIESYLETLVWKKQVEEEIRRINKLLEKVKLSPKGFSSKSIREDRDAH